MMQNLMDELALVLSPGYTLEYPGGSGLYFLSLFWSNFKIANKLQKKKHSQLPHTLHPAIEILSNHGTVIKIKKLILIQYY